MKKRIIYLAILCLIMSSLPAFSQEATTDSIIPKVRPPKSVEYGLNMSALAVQFIPLLNRTTARTGPYSFMYKKFRGEHAFRMGLGIHINPNEAFNASEPLNNLNICLGYERRKELSEHWRYSSGISAMFFLGNLNSPIGNIINNSNEGGGGGLGFHLGAEYRIIQRLSIGTEGTLFVGATGNGTVINFIPPVSIFLTAKFK